MSPGDPIHQQITVMQLMQITKGSDEELLFFPLMQDENPPTYLIFAHWMCSVTLIFFLF